MLLKESEETSRMDKLGRDYRPKKNEGTDV